MYIHYYYYSCVFMTYMVQHETQQSNNEHNFLNNDERKIISQLLLINDSYGGKLKHGTIRWIASLYSVSTATIYRLWRQVRQTGDSSHKRTKNCYRKRVEIDIEKVRKILLAKRSTQRRVS